MSKVRTKAGTGKMARTKGLAFERLVAQAFRPIFPEAIRQLEFQAGLGVDLTNTGNLRIQCKRGRKYAPLSMIEEVPEVSGTIPALVTQGDRKEALIALRFDDFLRILQDPKYATGESHNVPHQEKTGGESRRENRDEEDHECLAPRGGCLVCDPVAV